MRPAGHELVGGFDDEQEARWAAHESIRLNGPGIYLEHTDKWRVVRHPVPLDMLENPRDQ